MRLAIIAALEKKPADFAAFLRLMEESGFAVKRGRGGVVSFLAPGQDKYTRLRASTLGAGFDPEDIRAVIAGERPLPELPKDAPPPIQQVGLIIDIQQRMAEGKGPAYERWAKVYNLKQMAAALQFLQENNLTNYDALKKQRRELAVRKKALYANIYNPASDFTGYNACYLYKGTVSTSRKQNNLSDKEIVLAPHKGFIPSKT